MTEYTLKNKEIQKHLDYIKDSVIGTVEQYNEDYAVWSPATARIKGESFCTEEMLLKMMKDENHKGFPMQHYSIPLSRIPNQQIIQATEFARNDFIKLLGANDSAVTLYYPPGGFVGWHTNENNSGYQFIFSWSEKGNGYFQYYDKQKQQIIKLPDKAGWQVRGYHFGEEEADHCWHSMYTNVPRITVCVLFRWWDKPEMKEQILLLKDQLIEELESEY